MTTRNSSYTKHIEDVDCPQEANHTPAPRGWGEHMAWAQEMSKTHKQVRCAGCRRWAIWIPKPTPEQEAMQRDPL